MSDNQSWEAGRSGTAPPSNTDWNAFNAGKSIRDHNERELARQAAAWSPPTAAPPVWGAGDTHTSRPATDGGSATWSSGGTSFGVAYAGGSLVLGVIALVTM